MLIFPFQIVVNSVIVENKDRNVIEGLSTPRLKVTFLNL